MAVIDNYLDCEAYGKAPDSDKYSGFKSWFDETNQLWYFAVVTNKGRVVLRSEGYTTEAARDNGIEAVNRNRDIEERYSTVQDEDGQWYVILKAGNHQEIARSCPYGSEADAKAGIAVCFSGFLERAMAVLENYLPCEAYAAAPDSDKYPGFKSWYNEADGQWYFAAVTDAGRVVLRSEAYTTEAARNNGIESVIRNRDIEARYSVMQDASDGLWYVILKAGNHQEIARSCAYDSEAAARAGIAASFSTFSERKSAKVVENYLDCEAYAGKPASAYEGFLAFYDDDTKQHYFSVVDKKGAVLFRSEGYTSEAGRNNGIESVIRNRDIEERYVKVEEDGRWYVSLRAGNRQEIARSCALDDEAAAAAFMRRAMAKPVVVEDYLPCEAYSDKESSKYEGFTAFRNAENGLFYFAMVDKSGKVVLKSEGYKEASSRDNGIESVIKNRDIEERWTKEKDDEGYYMSLHAGNRQEIARTCGFESEGALLGWWIPFTGLLAFGKADAGKSVSVTPPVVAPASVAPPVAPPPVAPPPPPVTTYMEPAATAGGNSWWKWLLPLLLLAGLLFFLLRSCDGCKQSETPKTAVTAPTPVPAAPADTVKTAVTPPPPAKPTCNCSAATDPVFKLNASAPPKSLSRLGTNPEFGNSHGLTPEEFFAKLSERYQNNTVDKAFLDRMFKAMGYAEGFASAKATQFSAVEIPAGTVGNIGYSKAHKTLYARLDTQGKDLLAFRIEAANGCDLHFMKTCGNHFFACPN